MPTESVINRDFKSLFQGNTVRYEIPFFQRGYAWQNRQWKKLLEDLNEEVLGEIEDNNFEDAEHFFGPIVVLEKKHSHPNLKRFYIIDGQQRITTVYLMLALICKALKKKSDLSHNAQQYVNEINTFLVNNIEGEDDYLKLKVFSSKGDRLPTYHAVFETNPSSPYLSEDQQLYVQGENNIDQFVKYFTRQIKNHDVPELWALYQAIVKSLKVVWIPLDEEKDNAQAIFESLNDAGMPLTAAELLCNYLFRPLIDEKTNLHEKLHNDKWLKARREVGEDQFEEYLRNLFSIGEKKRVGKDRRMYVHFKNRNKKLTDRTALSTLDMITDYAKHYNRLLKPLQSRHPNDKVQKSLSNLFSTNVTAHFPFSMALLVSAENGKISFEECAGLLQEIYVMIIRRKISNLRMTKFDTFFPSLHKYVLDEQDKIFALHTQLKKEGLWVTDQEFGSAFINKELYNSRELGFTHHVLRKIDIKMHEYDELPDYTTLNTVEHVLPQNPDENWRIYLGSDSYDPNLPRITNTIGNLCLNSRTANSSKGRKSFDEKVENYNDLSSLARDIKDRKQPWNIEAIQKRSKDLADIALGIWNWKV
jgi:uncharacterized protein with ParB-like and HNH nuclease domain